MIESIDSFHNLLVKSCLRLKGLINKMNTYLPALFLVVSLVSVYSQTTVYTDRYDNIDLNQILNNKRLLDAYIKCLLDTGRCTPEGREMKAHISEALQNGCAQCTPKQRAGSQRVIQHLIKNENASWQQLVNKYDPNRKYTKQYEDELAQITSGN